MCRASGWRAHQGASWEGGTPSVLSIPGGSSHLESLASWWSGFQHCCVALARGPSQGTQERDGPQVVTSVWTSAPNVPACFAGPTACGSIFQPEAVLSGVSAEATALWAQGVSGASASRDAIKAFKIRRLEPSPSAYEAHCQSCQPFFKYSFFKGSLRRQLK